ncbi:hypothetical protein Barb6_02221 [Bacteroidales bacterium Barb6]|nr:hypothetical protein Barb6_02214 [Bacteroidales bacterium Barb6]OAV67918.1 hypothetical protein Barb6_02221 [Bacteroidales bacterium Barb6]
MFKGYVEKIELLVVCIALGTWIGIHNSNIRKLERRIDRLEIRIDSLETDSLLHSHKLILYANVI